MFANRQTGRANNNYYITNKITTLDWVAFAIPSGSLTFVNHLV